MTSDAHCVGRAGRWRYWMLDLGEGAEGSEGRAVRVLTNITINPGFSSLLLNAYWSESYYFCTLLKPQMSTSECMSFSL